MLNVSDERCLFVGMVHLEPLPGSPGWGGRIDAVVDAAVADAQALVRGGCDAIIVENMGDVPYLKGGVEAETVAAMARATAAVTALGIPVGVQVLAGANREALAVALACGAKFIRVEAFAYGHVADEGWMDACAGELVRARALLGAGDIKIWADIRKKHSAHALTQDLDLTEIAKGHVFCGADALIVTGQSTGEPTDPNDLMLAREAGIPVVVGSGVDAHNIHQYAHMASALIVGSALKFDGDWRKRVDESRVRELADALARA